MVDSHYKTVTILLIEDDDIDAMSVERSLKKMCLANPLIRAVDGVDALTLLRNGTLAKPYIVLLDLNLPRMRGLEFLKEIRDDDTLCEAVVFVLTTSKNEDEIAEAYRKNVAGYIVKSNLNHDFSQVLTFLDHYWRIVEMPT